jgi:uncharacterized metal-binding protein
MPKLKQLILPAILILFLLANLTLGILVYRDTKIQRKQNQVQQVNLKILSFTNMFIEKVLISAEPVSFDTRLTLETMVHNLGDSQIQTQWQRFTASTDKQHASVEAKALLNLLVKKIGY